MLVTAVVEDIENIYFFLKKNGSITETRKKYLNIGSRFEKWKIKVVLINGKYKIYCLINK